MRIASAALCAAGIALWAGAGTAAADSPVVLEGADEEQREAILDLLPDREAPTTLFEAERITEEAAARAGAWLRSEGYYAAEIVPEAQEDPPLARLRIAPGRRFVYAAPELKFVGAAPDAASARAAQEIIERIVPGAPARAAEVLQVEGAAVLALQDAGYADASAAPRRVIVDHAASTLKAEFNVSAGAPVRLGDVRAEPGGAFRDSFIERLRNWEPGDAYSPEKLARIRRDFNSTGAVSRLTTRLEPAGADGLRDVVLEVEAAKRNAYELGIGYSTTEGAGVEGEWTRRNLTGRADPLIVSATLSELLQSAEVELRRPHAAGLERMRRYSATIAHEDTTAFSRNGIAIATSVDADQRLDLGLSYGVQLSANFYDETAGVENAYVLSTFAELRNDTTDVPLDARDGSIVELRVEPALSAGDESLAFVRATADGRIYESFGEHDRVTLAARTRLGWVEAVSGNVNDIPPDRRFYAGGGGSVRGYEYNSIYPLERDALGLTPGGQGAFEVSMESRVRFGDRIGGVVFVDGGNAFDSWEDAADLKWGVGFGARYDLGFAPLRVDVAFPLDPGEDDPDFALYISLGQAF
ncbi:MAG: BamA/TamA family outer membrane protein [Terricaulis sp.]